MNLIRLLIYQTCFALALRHAYLEALLHKALDPLFGSSFVISFLASYDFDQPQDLSDLHLEMWNRRAIQQSSAWLLKLNYRNFTGLIDVIFTVVCNLKEVVRREQLMRYEDVVEECAWRCVELSVFFRGKDDVNIRQKADLCRDFVYVIYNVHRRPNQTGYFSMLNAMNEEIERSLYRFERTSVNIVEYDYEQMNRLAMILKALQPNLNFGFENILNREKPTPYAEGLLRFACYTRFKELCRREGTTQDLEITLSKADENWNALVSTILEFWLPNRNLNVFRPIFNDMSRPVAFISITKKDKTVNSDNFYPLPLSIIRAFEKTEASMTSSEICCCLIMSLGYRKFAYELKQLHNNSQIPFPKKIAIQKHSRLEFLKTLPRESVPFNLFHWHTLMLTHSMTYNSSTVHFSNLPVEINRESSPGGLEWKLLQNIAWWINEVTKSVPISERNEHLKMVMEFTRHEVSEVIPFEQRELFNSTIVLMIDGGLSST